MRSNQWIPKGNRSWIFIGRTGVEAEAPILWPPDAKSPLIGKYPGSGKDWRQKEKRAENEMVEWHHQLNGHEFEQALGEGEGQGSLVCCSPWGHKELDTTEWLNLTEMMITGLFSKTMPQLVSSVSQLCPTLCDPMGCSTPGLPVHHQLPEFSQTHVHWVGDAIQPFHPLLSPSPPAFNLSQIIMSACHHF